MLGLQLYYIILIYITLYYIIILYYIILHLTFISIPLIYIFFEVMLMSRIDGIGSCLKDYILLFVFDVYFQFLQIYVRVFPLRNFGFSDISLFDFIYFYKFFLKLHRDMSPTKK